MDLAADLPLQEPGRLSTVGDALGRLLAGRYPRGSTPNPSVGPTSLASPLAALEMTADDAFALGLAGELEPCADGRLRISTWSAVRAV